MIRNWRDAVQAERTTKEVSNSSWNRNTPSSSAISPSSSGSGSTTPKPSESTTPSAARKGQEIKTDGVNTQLYENDTRNASVSALYTSLAVDRDDSPKHILRIAIEIEAEVYKSEYLKVSDSYRNRLRSFTMNLRNKKNPELRERILSKQILPAAFIKMTLMKWLLRH